MHYVAPNYSLVSGPDLHIGEQVNTCRTVVVTMQYSWSTVMLVLLIRACGEICNLAVALSVTVSYP